MRGSRIAAMAWQPKVREETLGLDDFVGLFAAQRR